VGWRGEAGRAYSSLVGLYARRILPRLLDFAMRNPWATVERRRLIPRAAGLVLEVGAGSGLNLRFYGPGVTRVIAVDPSLGLWRLARRRVARAEVPVGFVAGSGEAIPLPDASVDTAVLTWTLCSIPDPAAALAELRRVLRPRGRLLFVEHGRAPDASVRRWQERITPHWRRWAGGCHLDRPIDALIRTAGFTFAELEARYVGHPRAMTYFYRGMASPEGPAPPVPET
jgi:ubiquinone/menaquinone biosynthesis C-methylase UbiE